MGFVLHTPRDGGWKSSIAVTDQIGITTSRDILEAMAEGDFYILCPDNDVTREMDEKRIAWAFTFGFSLMLLVQVVL